LVMENDDDLIAWVDPDLLAREKKITAIKKMLYASNAVSNGLPPLLTGLSTPATTEHAATTSGRLSLSALTDSVAQLRFTSSNNSVGGNENDANISTVERSRSFGSCSFVEFDPLSEHHSTSSNTPVESVGVTVTKSTPTEGDDNRRCSGGGQEFFHLIDCCSNASSQARRLFDYSKSMVDLFDQLDIYRQLIISRRRFDLVSPDTSLKVTVHTSFDQRAPVLFACHIRSSIGQIIGCVLCSFNSARLLPIEQYAIKRFGIDEYLLPDSALADYVFVHDCLKLGHDPELELVDLPKIIEIAKSEESLLPTLINNNNNNTIIINSTTIGSLKRDDLKVVLNTVRQECEKLLDESATAFHRKVNSKFVVQSVKALCSLFHRVENLPLIKAVKKFITACNMEVNGEIQSEMAFKKYKNVKNAINCLVDAIEKLCVIFCQSFETNFTVALSANCGTDFPCSFSPVRQDITDSEENFHFMIETVHNLPQNWMTKYSQFYLACHLIYGEKELCSVLKTNCGRSDRHFYEYLLFDAWITLPVPLCAMPRETKLCLALYGQHVDLNACEQNSNTADVACLIDEQLCFSVTPLFDMDNILLNGTKLVTFYPGSELKSWLPQLSEWSESPVSFPYNEPKMHFPDILPNTGLSIGRFDQLDCNIKLLLEDMIENRGLKELDRDEKDFIWEKRIYLTNFDEALPLVLSSAVSWDWACLSNIYALVQLWRPVPTSIAMELLLPNYADEFVRKYAVSCLRCNPVDSLMDILPQLVEVLRFERFECSSLAECLLKFAVESRAFAELESHKMHPGWGLRCHLLQSVLVTVVGPGMPTEVRLQKALLVQLHLLDSWLLQTHVRVPLNPSVLAVGVFTENSKVYRSLTCPVKVSFRTVSSNFDIMYKSGDDLRQDSLVLQMIRLMDYLWLKENLDLRMVVYRILPLQDKKGVIELVKNAKTLREIQVEEGGMTGVLRDDLIQKWLQKQNPSELEYQIMYKMKVERENVKVPSFVYRSYDEFCEFAESIYFRFPLIKMHSLPRGVTLRSNVRGVASDLVYTFFHPIFRDEQADIKSKTLNLHHPENVSGEVKVQVEFRQGLLEIFINHARNLSLINGINLPDSYVKCYILPDKRGWSKKKTRVVRGTRDPTYNEMFVYRVPASQLKCKVLEISVWHYDLLKGNNFLGSITIPMADICDIPVQMANTKWAYVRKFEQAEICLMNTWIVVRLDGCSFRRFTAEHRFEKPNDIAGLRLMSSAAKSVLHNYKDIRIAYGHSDEFSFVFCKRTNLWNRRLQKLLSTITSLFTSSYIFQWNLHFSDDRPLIWAPCFDGRVVLYPTDENLTDYLKWRQADCHINNLYNTVFWKLVNEGGLKPDEAEKRLCGSTAADKNEILFSQFNTNYNNEPVIFRKGTVLYRNVDGETVDTFHGSIIDDKFWQSNAHLLK
ncbi:Phosphatidylinositol 4-phosphate 3-kinase C2 domain-containing subunit beta, partial [Trichinella pseudospiralis]